MPNAYRLFIDRQNGKLLRAPDSYQMGSIQDMIRAADDSQIPLELIPLDAVEGGGYEAASYATDDVRLAIGNTSEVPTGGTFELVHSGNNSEAINVEHLNADVIERALNNIASIDSAGGVQVTRNAQGYMAQAITNGALGAITADEVSLVPHGTVSIVELQAGSATTKGAYQINLKSDPYALLTNWSALSAASIALSTIKAGSSTQYETQRIAITGAVRGGYFTISDGSSVTAALNYDASAADVEDALNGILGANTVTVDKPNSRTWDIRWASVGDKTALTVDGALTSWSGLSGTLQLNTTSLAASIAGKGSIPAVAQIVETITASNEKIIYSEDLELEEEVVSNATLTTIATGLLPTLQGQATFTAATRAAEVPDFVGQVGVETDTGIIYIATATTAGSWTPRTLYRVTSGAELVAAQGAGYKHFEWIGTGTLGGGSIYTIDADESLTINQGSYIDFSDDSQLVVLGNLHAPPTRIFYNVTASLETTGLTHSNVSGLFGGQTINMAWWLTPDGGATDWTNEVQAAVQVGHIRVETLSHFPQDWKNANTTGQGAYAGIDLVIPPGGIKVTDTINLAALTGNIRGIKGLASAISFQGVAASVGFEFEGSGFSMLISDLSIHVNSDCAEDFAVFGATGSSSTWNMDTATFERLRIVQETPGDMFRFNEGVTADVGVQQITIRDCLMFYNADEFDGAYVSGRDCSFFNISSWVYTSRMIVEGNTFNGHFSNPNPVIGVNHASRGWGMTFRNNHWERCSTVFRIAGKSAVTGSGASVFMGSWSIINDDLHNPGNDWTFLDISDASLVGIIDAKFECSGETAQTTYAVSDARHNGGPIASNGIGNVALGASGYLATGAPTRASFHYYATSTMYTLSNGNITAFPEIFESTYIASGILTIKPYCNTYHPLPEADVADDLITINGGHKGQVITLRDQYDSQTITVKSTGNIKLNTAAGDFAMNNKYDVLQLVFEGTYWCEVSRSDNGA